jgi:hypothetical protein
MRFAQEGWQETWLQCRGNGECRASAAAGVLASGLLTPPPKIE